MNVALYRHILRFYSLLLSLFPFAVQAGADSGSERLYFNHLSVSDGLSQNLARVIMQDHQGFVWVGTKDGLNRFDGQEVRVFRTDESDPNSIGCNYISSLYQDDGHILWVGTEKGIYRYDPEYERFAHFDMESSTGRKVTGDVVGIKKDDSGRIWMAEIRGALFCFNPETGTLDSYPYEELYGKPLTVRCLEIDRGGTVWLGDFGNGLLRLSQDRRSLIPWKKPGSENKQENYVNSIIRGPGNSLVIGYWGCGVELLDLDHLSYRILIEGDERQEPVFCRVMARTEEDLLLVGSESGLYVYDLQEDRLVNHVVESTHDRFALSDKAVHAVYGDRNGGIWVGTYYGGVDYCLQLAPSFKKYYVQDEEGGLSGRRVHQFCRDVAGRIWLCTSDAGLNVFDPETERFEPVALGPDFRNMPCLCLIRDELWVGTNTQGILVLDPDTRSLKHQYKKTDLPGSICDNGIFAILQCRDGDVYVGTYLGMQRYDGASDRFIHENGIPPIYISTIYEDRRGRLWAGSSRGVFMRPAKGDDWVHYISDPSNPGTLPSDKIKSVFEDSHGIVWILTNGGGFCRYLPEKGTFKTYDSRDGLSNDVVFRMEEDMDGLLWISTNNGLVSFDPLREQFRIYTVDDGLLSNQFNDRSSMETDDGTLYFGCIEGFISFDPRKLTDASSSPHAVLTGFSVQGIPVQIGLPGSPLRKSLSYQDKVVLKHNQNSFSFRVCSFDYHRSFYGRMLCRLEGTDEEWHPVAGNPYVRYSGLNPGRYRFVVKDSFSNTEDAPLATLSIRIRPPWYASAVAKFAYLLAFLSAIALLVWRLRRRNELAYRRRVEDMEKETERELFESKLQFFTNIAHEIRTPVTLISGPLDNILEHNDFTGETAEDLNLMKSNTSRLLSLINQLLDFRKIERSGVKVRYNRCNISDLVRETEAGFRYMLQDRNIDYTSDLPDEDVVAVVDREALRDIVSNLLNNGVKYADSVLTLSLETSSDSIIITTRNDGNLIPAKMRDAIFKPFVRVDADRERTTLGTGLGLTYARSLAEAQGGSLQVVEDPEWNVFRLELPAFHEVEPDEDLDGAVKEEDTDAEMEGGNHPSVTILLVEDEKEMREFIRRGLAKSYKVLMAADGLEAKEKLEMHKVDLLVSDIMMPRMNGFELCHSLKSDIRYSHVPVILLTALADDKSHITGLETGADAYIEKPFSMDILKAGIASLLQNRENIRRAFAQSPVLPVTSVAVSQTDKDFVNKIYDIISQNYSNVDFRIDEIASALNMSRASFYRKIQGVLDMTPNDLLRLERLKRAACLLKEKGYRISEVCYMTGFSSPSYFTKCFHQQFGMSPKEFMES